MIRSRLRFAAALLAMTALLTACGDDGSPQPGPASSSPNDWVLDSEPSDAVDVKQAKASAEAGDSIVLRARIGGRIQPISDDSAVFTVMDMNVPHCGMIEGDGCPTPWDYCCEAPETIRANAATVQLVDAEGNAAAISPTAAGLAPLDEVVIVGTVGPRPTPDVLTVKAMGFYPVTP